MRNLFYLGSYLFFLATILLSCSNDNDRAQDILNNAKPVSTKEIPVDFLLGNPYQITINGDVLVISDNVEEKSLALYDSKDNIFLGRQLSIGQGPNEVIPPLLLSRSSEVADTLSLIERRSGRYMEYFISDLLESNVAPQKPQVFENTDRLTQTTGGFITEGQYDNGSIRLLDHLGEQSSEIISIYPPYINELENRSDQYVYGQGHIAFNRQSEVLAFATYFTGEVSFYRLNGASLDKLQDYDFSISSSLRRRIESTGGTANIQDTDIEYFGDIYSTVDHFYFLYSGVPMKDKRTMGYSYIFKFSSEGEFIESYKTNLKVLSLCVKNDDSKLYGVGLSNDMEYALVEVDTK